MYNETLKSFVDSGRIVSYKKATTTNWVGSEEGPTDHWEIVVRRVYGNVDIEGLQHELQSALGNAFLRFIDEAAGVDIDRIPDGAIVFKHNQNTGTFAVCNIAPDGQFLFSSGGPERDFMFAEARKLAVDFELPLIDRTASPYTITKPADLKGGDA